MNGASYLDGYTTCFCSPMSSSSYRFMDSSRPGSASSQPSATRSHSSGQMFFPAPSNPHKIIHPSCSPPPPYSATDKHMHSSPSSIAEDHLYHGERASPVPAYYNQVLCEIILFTKCRCTGSDKLHQTLKFYVISATYRSLT